VEELAAEPERFDCETCEWRLKHAALWTENSDALELYQTLGRRIVSACSLHGVVLARWMADRTSDEVLTMVARLDLIHSLLGADDDDGRPRTQNQTRR
jgi:hypothetical protein